MVAPVIAMFSGRGLLEISISPDRQRPRSYPDRGDLYIENNTARREI